MSNITWADKSTGDQFTAEEANQVKSAVNSKADALTSDQNYVTDAQLVVIGNTSGTNTGDQDLSGYQTVLTNPLVRADIDDTPVNGEITGPISSNWAYDHEHASDPHTGYVLESALDSAVAGNSAVVANTAKVSFDSTSSTRLANTSGTNTGDQTAATVSVDASGFNGNLATTDNTVQKVAQKLDDLSVSGSMTYPGAGIPNSTGSAWGTSYALDTDISTTSANDDTIPSAKAVKTYVDTTVASAGGYTDEMAQDAVGAMVTGNTETGISVTYDDATAKLNFSVDLPVGGTPALTLGTANTAGSSPNFLRRDDTILAFDATSPATEAYGDTAVVGTATVAARRDHRHAMPAALTDATIATTDVTTNNASTTKHGWLVKATAPSSGLRNVVAIDNGETAYTNKALFDATSPAAETSGASAVVGTAMTAARRDHVHAMPTIPTVSDTAYDATSWNGNTDAPTKNAIRDKIESMSSGLASLPTADNQILQATGVGTYEWSSDIEGLINDAGTTTADVLSAAEIDDRIAAGAGMANPMTTAGDMVKGGTSGAAARMIPGTGVVAALEANANGTGGVVTVGNAAGSSAVLTGYTSGSGTVAGTDTILQAIQKLNGNDVAHAAASDPHAGYVLESALGTGVGAFLATPSGASLATALTTALPASKGGTGLTALGTNVATALGVAIGSAGAPVLFNGALGTPSSGTLTNCTFPTLNQNTTGSAATLTTARTIGGVSFNGSANINLPGVNAAGNQNTSGNAATVTNATLTTALTVNTGPVTLVGNAAGSSQITIPNSSVNLPAGDVVNRTASETLTNKTLSTGSVVGAGTTIPVCFTIAASDEDTAITAGAGKRTFRAPYAFTLTGVRASCKTAPTGANIIIDVNETGTTSVLATKITIEATEKSSVTAATQPVIGDSAIADDADMSIDFDQVGSTIAGTGVKITLYGTRAIA